MANPYLTRPYDDLRADIELRAGVTIHLVTMTEADGWPSPEVWGTANRESDEGRLSSTVASALGSNEIVVLDEIAKQLGIRGEAITASVAMGAVNLGEVVARDREVAA